MRFRNLAAAGAALAAVTLTACGGGSATKTAPPSPTSVAQLNSLRPSARASVIRSRAETVLGKIICQYHAQGMTSGQIFTAIYTPPESAVQVRQIIATDLANC